MWDGPYWRLSAEELVLSNCGAGEDSWESLRQQGNQISQSSGKSVMNIQWNNCCWIWSSNALAQTVPAHWCWERLEAEGEGDDRGWDGWMASPTRWRWVWANSKVSGITWRTGKPVVRQCMGSQRVGQNLATEQQKQFGIWATGKIIVLLIEMKELFQRFLGFHCFCGK